MKFVWRKSKLCNWPYKINENQQLCCFVTQKDKQLLSIKRVKYPKLFKLICGTHLRLFFFFIWLHLINSEGKLNSDFYPHQASQQKQIHRTHKTWNRSNKVPKKRCESLHSKIKPFCFWQLLPRTPCFDFSISSVLHLSLSLVWSIFILPCLAVLLFLSLADLCLILSENALPLFYKHFQWRA